MFLAKHEPDQYIAGGDKVGNKMFFVCILFLGNHVYFFYQCTAVIYYYYSIFKLSKYSVLLTGRAAIF